MAFPRMNNISFWLLPASFALLLISMFVEGAPGMTGFGGGKLETTYKELKSDYDGCASRADAVNKRVREMETMASDLFAEWEKELTQYNSPTLQAGSRQ